MNKNNITIPNPCNEKWNSMTDMNDSRFCNICNNIVVDFTSMTTDEVKNYFLNSKEKHICGRLKPSQVINNYNKLQQFLIDIYNYTETKIKYRFIVVSCLLFISFILMLSGCETPVGTVIVEDTTLNRVDSIKIDSSGKGLIRDTVNVNDEKPR